MNKFIYYILFSGAVLIFIGQWQNAHALSIPWSGPMSFNNHNMFFTPVNDVTKITIYDIVTEQAFAHDHGGSSGSYTGIRAIYTDNTSHAIFNRYLSAGKSFKYGGLSINLSGSPDIKGLEVWSNPDQNDTFHRWNGVYFDVVSGPSTTSSPNSVPEPGTIALLGIGLAGLVGVGARRRANEQRYK